MGDTYDDNIPNFHCGDCRYWNGCTRRIDYKTIKFAIPWFKSYDENQHAGIICSDFEPSILQVDAKKHWKGFKHYWELYVKQWLPYENVDTNIYFTLNDDTSIRYGVKLLDFVFGSMIEEGILNANEKQYYKRDTKSPIGYKLMRENIKGIRIS